MPVLIGLVDQRISSSYSVGWDTNKIGGLPAWINLESSSPIPECKNCGQVSSLVAQIYCPLGGSSYHRCIYLFVCPGVCSKQESGWRVFRSMKHDSNYQSNTSLVKNSSSLSECSDEVWAQEQDDWGGDQDNDSGNFCEDTHHIWTKSSPDSVNISNEAGQIRESSSPQIESDRFTSASIETAIECVAGPVSQQIASEDGVFNDALHQGMESLSQLMLSDAGEQDDDYDSVQCKDDSIGERLTVLDPTYRCDDTDDPLESETVELTDTDRLDAMSKILNTKLEQVPEPTRSKRNCTIVFEPYYLSVVDEPIDQLEFCDHINDLIRNYERTEGKQLHQLISQRPISSKGKDGPATEMYERSELKHGDRIFYKFMKQFQKCPQQCVRYERGGNPLLVSKLPEQAVKKCSFCGGEIIFELQLLPPLIPFLKAQDGTSCEVEFGTVLIFTCERNCWPAEHDPAYKLDLLEELVVLQGDPDIHLYR